MSDFRGTGAEKSGHKLKIFQVQLGDTKIFLPAAYILLIFMKFFLLKNFLEAGKWGVVCSGGRGFDFS